MFNKKTPLGKLLGNFEDTPQNELVIDRNTIITAIIGQTPESAAKSKKGIKIASGKLPTAMDFMSLISMLRNAGIPEDNEDMPEIIGLRTDKKSLNSEAKKDNVEARIAKLQTDKGFTIAGLTALFVIARYIREKKIKMRIFIGTAAVLAIATTVVVLKMLSDKNDSNCSDDYYDDDEIEIEDPDDDNILDIDEEMLDEIDDVEVETETPVEE